MAETTNISWCDHTFSPWIGCTKIAPACDGCYAAHLMDTRLGRVKWDGPPVRTSAGNWRQPFKWNRAAYESIELRSKVPWRAPFVFCSSLADVFDNQADPAWRADLFQLIRDTPYLTWLLLTKRPQNIVKMSGGPLPANAAIGTTCEDQKHWDLNLPHLIAAKAQLAPAFAFVSIEPLLGPIWTRQAPINKALRPFYPPAHTRFDPLNPRSDSWARIDWVITGGETDQGAHKARPTHPQWFRDIRDQCAAAGVAYHHKQNGEWLALGQSGFAAWSAATTRDGTLKGKNKGLWLGNASFYDGPTGPLTRTIGPVETRNVLAAGETSATMCAKVGKKHSGRLLDGITHDAFPELRA